MSKSKVFVILSVSFCCGILLGSGFNFSKSWILLFMAFCIAGFVYLVGFSAQSRPVWIIPAAIFFGGLGFLYIQAWFVPSEYESMFDSKESLEGVIVEDIDMRSDKQLLTVKIDGHSQNLLVTTTKGSKFFYGDRVWLTGKVVEAKAFEDFDYKGYLERHNVYGLMRYPKAIVLKTDQGNKIVYELLRLKQWFVLRLSKVLASPYDSLLLGILIGAKRALPEEVYQQFINTGTSHIIAISGFNISVIVGALAFLPYYFGRRLSFLFTLVVIGIFVVMSGASASVVRAALMGGLLLTSLGIGRLYSITPALCCAAVLMLLANPRILFWDVGFQLSFLATAGIVYAVPNLELLTEKWPNFFGMKTIFFTTLSAIVATLPLSLFEFGRVSLVALVVNMLVLPIVPAAMFFGFLSALPLVGPGFAFVAQYLLAYMLAVIGYFAGLNSAALDLNFNLNQLLLSYVAVFLLYFLLHLLAKKLVEKP